MHWVGIEKRLLKSAQEIIKEINMKTYWGILWMLLLTSLVTGQNFSLDIKDASGGKIIGLERVEKDGKIYHAYCHGTKFKIIEVTDLFASNPDSSEILLDAMPFSLFSPENISENLVYLQVEKKLLTIDLRQPLQPAVVNELDLRSRGIIIQHQNKLLITNTLGVQFIDISNPQKPESINFFGSNQDLLASATYKNRLFLGTRQKNILIYDSTSNPALIDSLNLGVIPKYLAIYSGEDFGDPEIDYLIAAADTGIFFYSLENTRRPTIKGFFPAHEELSWISSGQKLGKNILAIYSPRRSWFIRLHLEKSKTLIINRTALINDAVLDDPILHITAETHGLGYFRLNRPNPPLIDLKQTGSSPFSFIQHEDDIVYTLESGNILGVYKISPSEDKIQKLKTIGDVYDSYLNIHNNKLYALSRTNWSIFDISEPDSPSFEKSFSIDGPLYNDAFVTPPLTIGNKLIYNDVDTLKSWDLFDPSNPVLTENLSLKERPISIASNSSHLIISFVDSLVHYKLVDGSINRQRSYPDVKRALKCVIKGNIVYVSTPGYTKIIHLESELVNTPEKIEDSFENFATYQNLGLLFNFDNEVLILDLEDPEIPMIKGNTKVASFEHAHFLDENRILMLDKRRGVLLYGLNQITSISPFNNRKRNLTSLKQINWKWHFRGIDALGRQ